MMTRRDLTTPLLSAALTVFLGACGSLGGPSDEIVSIGQDPRIAVHDLSSGPDMAVGGTLVYLPDHHCFAIEGGSGDASDKATPIWPRGTRPMTHGGRRGVDVPSFGRIVEGETVNAGGDIWDPDDERTRELGLTKGCRSEGGFIVFNPDSFG